MPKPIPTPLALLKGQSDEIVKENARRLMKGRGLPAKEAVHQATILAGLRPVWPPGESPLDSLNSTKPSTDVH